MNPATDGVLAAAGPSAWWYLNRGTGMVTLVLLTASVVLGIVEQQHWRPDGWPSYVVHRLHRNVSLLVMVFLTMHIVASVVDAFAPIRLVDAVVPFVSAYRPLWLGLGAVVFDLLLAITITSLLRRRIGQRNWRLVHWLSYAAWPIAVAHGVGTGTDVKQGWMLALTGLCVAAVVAAIWLRVIGSKLSEQARPAAYAALLLGPLIAIVWLPSGPLAPGWARKAGTPPALLGVSSGRSTISQEVQLDAGFSEPMQGTIRRQRTGGLLYVELAMKFSGPPNGVASVNLKGRSTAGGQTNFTQGRATLGPASEPSLYSGPVKSIQNGNLHAIVADSAGRSLNLTIALTASGEAISGTIAAQPSVRSKA